MIDTFFKYVAYLAIILSTFLLGLVTYWLIPDNIITFENPQEIKVNKESYSPGERVIYELTYCKKKQSVGIIYRALVDGVRITYAILHSDLPVGCHTVYVADLVIPEYASNSTYYLEITGEYKINPLQTFRVYLRSEDFKVQ